MTSEREARELARRFHEAYERLAPQFGYETRAETRAFDPESANGKLMIATCAALTSEQREGVRRSTHRVFRELSSITESLPCYCEATSDHLIGREQPQQEAPGAVACYGMRRKGTTAIIGVVPEKIHARPLDPKRSADYMRDYEEVPLFTHPAPSDAVVEALRKLVAAAAWSATTNTPFAHNSAAVAEAKAALATRCPVVVDEDAREAIDAILSRLEGWAKAYPVDIFHEPTQEERDWLHATKPGLMDCISASMGRHMAKCVAEDLAALRAALEVPNG